MLVEARMAGIRRGEATTVDRDEADWLETVGLLVIEWGRLELRFPMADGSGRTRVDVSAAAKASGVSEKQIVRVRTIRNATVHKPADRPSLAALDEALGILELMWRALDGGTSERPTTSAKRELPVAQTSRVGKPDVYPNPRKDNAWDNDAVHWLLDHPDVAASFARGTLMECLRCQPDKVENQPHRVEEAARLARKHGVIQRQEYDAKLGKRVVRLYRTDPDRPRYPGVAPAPVL